MHLITTIKVSNLWNISNIEPEVVNAIVAVTPQKSEESKDDEDSEKDSIVSIDKE